MDERYAMHRYKSTSHAAVVVAVAMGGWVMYEQLVNHVLRWDLMGLLLAMAVTKVAAMIYYRLTD